MRYKRNKRGNKSKIKIISGLLNWHTAIDKIEDVNFKEPFSKKTGALY